MTRRLTARFNRQTRRAEAARKRGLACLVEDGLFLNEARRQAHISRLAFGRCYLVQRLPYSNLCNVVVIHGR